jgi:membrane protein
MNTSLTFYDFINNVIIGFLLIIACLPMDNISINIPWEIVIIPSYIIGLIYTKINEFTIGSLLRNYPILIEECYNKIHEEYNKRNKTEDIYYGTYYKGWKKYCERNVEILEAQLAFIRNIWPILVVYFIGIIITTNHLMPSIFEYRINLLPIIGLLSLMYFIKWLICIDKIEKINILECDILPYIFSGTIIGLCFINRCNNHYSPFRIHNIDIDTNLILYTIATFIIILLMIGHYVQKKIYKLVFEYDIYV